MIIKSISLKNFKCFEKAQFSFSDMTFIKGENGSGKTTIALDAILFVLFGYYRGELLADMITRGKAKKASVELILEHRNTVYTIKRAYPTHLSVKEGDKELKFVNSTDAQNWINKTFGDRLNFCRFRLIDTSTQDTNFLETGQTTIKKILFSATDEIFNNIKVRLNKVKAERERYSKDNSVVYTHYPSDKRLLLISSKIKDLNNQISIANNELAENETVVRNIKIKISSNETQTLYIKKQIDNIDNSKSSMHSKQLDCQIELSNFALKLKQNKKDLEELNSQNTSLTKEKICYVCKRPLEKQSEKEVVKSQKEKETELLQNIEKNETKILELQENQLFIEEAMKREKDRKLQDYAKNINDLKTDIINLTKEAKNNEEILIQDKKNRDFLSNKKEYLQILKMKLETRIKQKDFKYTLKDVEIVKKAIIEVDGLSTYYLTETVKILEPIINSVLEKIDFKVKFETNEKGKFEIKLERQGIVYKYKDLSTGQKLLLQIAFKLAILLERNSYGIIVADEGMSSLDEENLGHILQIFENYPFQLLLVLHRFNEVPDNIQVINLTKDK